MLLVSKLPYNLMKMIQLLWDFVPQTPYRGCAPGPLCFGTASVSYTVTN